SDQTTYAVSKAMARQPEDRYESYAAFISQLEDAKRRITDPNFKEKRQESVVILETKAGAKYSGMIIMIVVAMIILLVGIILWKGSSLFQPKNKPAEELNDYNPSGLVTPPAANANQPPPSSAAQPSAQPSASDNSVPAGGILIEAETATKLGGVKVYSDSVASGGSGIEAMNAVGDGIEFGNVPAASSFSMKYATPVAGPFTLYVNGAKAQVMQLDATKGWYGSYAWITLPITIPAGATLKLQRDEGDIGINVDCIILK
ncbi:MAG TPA: hypothetical protein VGC39_07535, partial [Candidatus Methylacidiphilales bacterium]